MSPNSLIGSFSTLQSIYPGIGPIVSDTTTPREGEGMDGIETDVELDVSILGHHQDIKYL
jgi:hypothetical protein